MSRTSKRSFARIGGITVGAGVLFVGGVLIASTPAFADNGPHIMMTNTDKANTQNGIGAGLTGGCASCHRAHSAKASGDLLKTDEKALCESCHGAAGNGSTTDVVDGVGFAADANGLRTGSAIGALRGGGFDSAALNASNATRGQGTASAFSANGWGINKANNVIGVLGGATTPTPAVTTSNHSVGVDNSTMWGNGVFSTSSNYGKTGVTLECASCHDPHGNGNYRILKPVPSDSGATFAVTNASSDGTAVTYTMASATTSPQIVAGQVVSINNNTATSLNLQQATVASVVLANASSLTVSSFTVTSNVAATSGTGGTVALAFPDAVTKTYTTTNYWKEGGTTVDSPNNAAGKNAFIASISAWCSTCHTRYLADSNGRSVDSGDNIFTFRHRSNNGAQDNPNCLQCHVAHGTNATMTGTSGSTEANAPQALEGTAPNQVLVGGDHGSKLLRVSNRGVCQMCHNK